MALYKQIVTPADGVTLAADTPPFVRLVINASGLAAIAGDDARSVGVHGANHVDISEDGAQSACHFHTGRPTNMVAAAAFTAGSTLYAAANGTVDDSGTVVEGVALEAAGAAGDVVSVLPTRTPDPAE